MANAPKQNSCLFLLKFHTVYGPTVMSTGMQLISVWGLHKRCRKMGQTEQPCDFRDCSTGQSKHSKDNFPKTLLYTCHQELMLTSMQCCKINLDENLTGPLSWLSGLLTFIANEWGCVNIRVSNLNEIVACQII